jgi:hypothetical protein
MRRRLACFRDRGHRHLGLLAPGFALPRQCGLSIPGCQLITPAAINVAIQ